MIEGLVLEHMGVAVPKIDAAISIYQDLFGYRLLAGPFDDPGQQATVAFVGTDDPHALVVELIAPLGEGSHVANWLSRGAGAYHVCYRVADIDQALAQARARRSAVIREPAPAVAYGGRRIAWVMLRTRQLVEFVEGEPG